MTKLFCDRCNTEIKNHNDVHNFNFEGSLGSWEGDLCEYCYKAFERFMKMEDSMYHTNYTNHDILHNPGNNHGIERTTFGSK